MKFSVALLAAFSISQVYSSELKIDQAAINQKLSIDFTKSDLVDLKTNEVNKTLMSSMERIGKDHAAAVKGKFAGLSLALNPLTDNKQYSYFFMFNVDSVKGSEGAKNCMAITNKEFTKYSASCFHKI